MIPHPLPSNNASPYKRACVMLEVLIYATHAYHQHANVERCPGCDRCPDIARRYSAARAEYDQAVQDLIG